MKQIFFFNNEKIISSLKRFLNFVLNENCNNHNKEDNNQTRVCLFIDEEFSIDHDLLTTFLEYNNPKIIVFGYTNCSSPNYINMLDFSNLKRNLQSALYNSRINVSAVLYIKEISNKIKQFFKGHGEESLINCLNWVRYYISNGPTLLFDKKLNWQEYKNDYLEPGLEYWQTFRKRFDKHKNYLTFSGFTKEIEKVSELITHFQLYIDFLKNSDDTKLRNIDTNAQTKKNISYLKEIDEIFSYIEQQLIYT